jgi:glycerol-3-phosphate cytidylyltransferase
MNILQNINKIKKNKLVGFTASTFDLLHAGHIDMLTQCKDECEYLIVGLLSNPQISRPDTKQAPIESMFERWVRLQSISLIDLIIPFDSEIDLENMLKIIKPHKRFVGYEYMFVEHTGKNIQNIEIIYNRREHNYSSTDLKNRLKNKTQEDGR